MVGEERANLSVVVSCNYVVSVWRGFLFLWVLGMGYVILLWHSLSLRYNYFDVFHICPLGAVRVTCLSIDFVPRLIE